MLSKTAEKTKPLSCCSLLKRYIAKMFTVRKIRCPEAVYLHSEAEKLDRCTKKHGASQKTKTLLDTAYAHVQQGYQEGRAEDPTLKLLEQSIQRCCLHTHLFPITRTVQAEKHTSSTPHPSKSFAHIKKLVPEYNPEMFYTVESSFTRKGGLSKGRKATAHTGLPVFCKQLKKRLRTMEVCITDLRKEAYLWHLLGHDIKILRVPVSARESKYYLVGLPLMDGDMQDFFVRHPRTAQEQQMHMCLSVAVSLQQLHATDIAHLDLKPANILYQPTPEGGIRTAVTDFGLSEKMSCLPDAPTKHLYQTPQYRAPECVNLRPHPQSDIYSLGLVFLQIHHRNHDAPPIYWDDSSNEPTTRSFAKYQEEYHAQQERFQVLRTHAKAPADIFATSRSGLIMYTQDTYRKNPALFEFIVTRMLDPNPETRCNIDEVVAFLKTLTPDTTAEGGGGGGGASG